MSQPNRRAVQGRRGLALAVALLVWAGGAGAQAPFAVEDVLDMRNVSIADVSDDGRYVVVTYASLRDRIGIDNHRFGDPTYVAPGVADVVLIDTRTGESRPLFRERRQVRGAEFSPDGSTVAMLLREGDQFTLATIDVASGRVRTARPPAGRLLAENSPLQWTADGTRLLVSLRTTEWARAAAERFQQEVKGPIVVQSSDDPFLSWEAIRRLSSLQIPALFNIADRRFHEIGDESVLASFALTGDGERLRYEPDITKKTSYEEIFGRESALAVRPVGGGEETTLFESTKGMRFLWSRDGTRFVYGKEGAIFAGSLEGGDPRRIAGPDSARRDSTAAPAAEPPDSAARAAERERRRSERFTPVRLSDDGRTVIASNSEGLWFIDTESGERQRFVDSPAEDPEADGAAAGPRPPRWSVVGWSRDGGTVWLSEDSRETWDRALHRHDRATGQRTQLIRGDAQLSGIDVSADGSRLVFMRAETSRTGDVWTANGDLSDMRRLTDANPQLSARALGEARLFEYLDVDGRPLKGVLYLPPDHREGVRLPTVFLVYEEFFDARFNATIALLNANGYAVVQPSVRLETGYPGEAWMKGVTSAANHLITAGIADRDRLGVHGTSYGGYATNLLITQTNRFKAAINISGKVDMISFYTDSPRLGTRNIHAPERSQDRIGGTLWDEPLKYIAHSAIMFADRIDTPLLLMTGQQDHNVPERTTSEMFYALRRLGKRVEWVSYINGGHGMPSSTVDEVIDYHQRILSWYDTYLKGRGTERADR
jgi:dipeptidyl aminopeptidase/acylaminoacyl peptidase